MLKINAENLDAATVLSLNGRVVSGETEILRNSIYSLPERLDIVLDLARVNTIDAHGLGVLLELRQLTIARGAGFKLMNVSHPLRKVFEITRLDSVFEITSGYEYFSAWRASVAA